MIDAHYWYHYWKRKGHERKGLADYSDCLDIKNIFHNKKSCPIKLNITQNDKIIGNIHISDKKITVFILSLIKKRRYQIMITSTPCNYGGFRYWFLCPACRRRCRKLYVFCQVYFFCRKCLNLGYFSQLCQPWTRCSLMADKTKKRLKSVSGNLSKKPKGMRWSTFERLQEKTQNYEMKSETAHNEYIFDYLCSRLPSFERNNV